MFNSDLRAIVGRIELDIIELAERIQRLEDAVGPTYPFLPVIKKRVSKLEEKMALIVSDVDIELKDLEKQKTDIENKIKILKKEKIPGDIKESR